MSKKAPRTALKLHMKKNTNIRIGKNADLMEDDIRFVMPRADLCWSLREYINFHRGQSGVQPASAHSILASVHAKPGLPLTAQLNILVVLHRLAEESRVKAFEEKSATIKVHHVRAVAKKLLKSTRG